MTTTNTSTETAPPRPRSAIVTGAAGGIGLTIAEDLARAGYRVGLTDLHEDPLVRATDHIRSVTDSQSISAKAADISDARSITAAIETLAAALGGLDVVVNCAGVLQDARVPTMTAAQFRRVLAINLGGMLETTTAALPFLKESSNGRIISLTSRAWLGNFGSSNYAASKGAIAGVSRSMALALASDGITVNCIAPGFIETPMSNSMPNHILNRVRRSIPVGRGGTPHDVGRAVAFLASEEAGYITGQSLAICGGRSIAGSLQSAG